jgi:hypothetical protein
VVVQKRTVSPKRGSHGCRLRRHLCRWQVVKVALAITATHDRANDLEIPFVVDVTRSGSEHNAERGVAKGSDGEKGLVEAGDNQSLNGLQDVDRESRDPFVGGVDNQGVGETNRDRRNLGARHLVQMGGHVHRAPRVDVSVDRCHGGNSPVRDAWDRDVAGVGRTRVVRLIVRVAPELHNSGETSFGGGLRGLMATAGGRATRALGFGGILLRVGAAFRFAPLALGMLMFA